MSLWNTRHSHNTAPGFSSLFRMLDDFDRYAQSGMGESAGSLRSFNPKFDIAEHEKDYVLQGELPGVQPENVVIEFTDPQTLVIRGHAKHERTEGDPSMAPKKIEAGKEQGKIDSGEAKQSETAVTEQKEGDKKVEKKEDAKPKAKYWLSERSYGEFSRVFSFPAAVDQDGVQAKLEHGVLNITVPKAEKKGNKKIEIKL
ncbi:30 kDa heat shock protein [Immersiella caudata]|uniref:30 kDa heat shock protein n=1 Tax=Immersiella caudata TaxID=314043 RepID=A0AA40BUE4_9PEZI|nr:30 kDa heat shock protein [Immersiella caudata]